MWFACRLYQSSASWNSHPNRLYPAICDSHGDLIFTWLSAYSEISVRIIPRVIWLVYLIGMVCYYDIAGFYRRELGEVGQAMFSLQGSGGWRPDSSNHATIPVTFDTALTLTMCSITCMQQPTCDGFKYITNDAEPSQLPECFTFHLNASK